MDSGSRVYISRFPKKTVSKRPKPLPRRSRRLQDKPKEQVFPEINMTSEEDEEAEDDEDKTWSCSSSEEEQEKEELCSSSEEEEVRDHKKKNQKKEEKEDKSWLCSSSEEEEVRDHKKKKVEKEDKSWLCSSSGEEEVRDHKKKNKEKKEKEDTSWLCSSSEEEEVRDHKKNNEKCKKRKYSKKTKYEDREMRRRRQRAIEMGDGFQSENPFFTIVLQPSYITHKYLPIPASFDQTHLLSLGKRIKAHVEDKEEYWLLSFPKNSKGRLTVGVPSFLKDNDLVVGDVITMEIMEEMTSIYLGVPSFRPVKLICY